MKFSETETKQKQYYNEIAKDHDKYKSAYYDFQYREFVINLALRDVDINSMKVLDAMCGSGQYTENFVVRGAEVTGIDISDHLCAIYREKFSNCKVVCGSVFDTSFADDQFDLIFINSLHHLHPRVDDGLSELIRILKPEGRLIIFDPSAGSAFDFIRKLWYRFDPKFFEQNEKSIDCDLIETKYKTKLNLLKKVYGGGLAYLFVRNAIIFRIPHWLPRYYYKILMPIERLLMKLQGRALAMWFLVVFQKI